MAAKTGKAGKTGKTGKTGMTRREILTGAAGAAAAASIGGLAGCFPKAEGTWPDGGSCGCALPDGGLVEEDLSPTTPVQGKSLVATIQRSDSVDSKGTVTDPSQFAAVQAMVDAVLSTLAGGADNPWSALLPGAGPCTRIGLKVNCLNSYFGTSPALVRALVYSLTSKLGVCPGNIFVWDRRLDELTTVGKYTAEDLQGAQLVGTLASTSSANGPGYSSRHYLTVQKTTPRLSRILTDLTDVTINCPVLKVHSQTGITAAMKNIFGVIDCPGKFHTDPAKQQDIQTALPALYNLAPIRKSIKLTIVDALRAVTNGDTESVPNAIPGRIFASTDPLALDYYALDLINQLRAAPPLRGAPITQPLDWMENAYQLGLGSKGYRLASLQADGTPATADGGVGDGGLGAGVGTEDDGGAAIDAAL